LEAAKRQNFIHAQAAGFCFQTLMQAVYAAIVLPAPDAKFFSAPAAKKRWLLNQKKR
jgi:hypothetical protein